MCLEKHKRPISDSYPNTSSETTLRSAVNMTGSSKISNTLRSSDHHEDRRFQLCVFTHQSKAMEAKSDASETVSSVCNSGRSKVPQHAPDPPVGVRQLEPAGIKEAANRQALKEVEESLPDLLS